VLALSIGLTLVSQIFVRPTDCRGLCDATNQAACPNGTRMAVGPAWLRMIATGDLVSASKILDDYSQK